MSQPRSVTGVLAVLVGQVVLGAVVAVLTIVMRDDLVAAWSADHPDTSGVKPPHFVPVAIVLFIVFASLVGVLGVFLRYGHPWARFALTVLGVFMAVGTLAGLRSDPPPLFVVLILVSVLLDVALVALLWMRDTGAYMRGGWLPSSSAPTPSA